MTTGKARAGLSTGSCIAPLGTAVGAGIGSVSCTSPESNLMPQGFNSGPPGYRSSANSSPATCACGNPAYTQPPKPSSTAPPGPVPTGYNCPCGNNQNDTPPNDLSQMLYYSLGTMELCWRVSGTAPGSSIVLDYCNDNSFSQYFTYHTDNYIVYFMKHYTSVSSYLCLEYDTVSTLLKV